MSRLARSIFAGLTLAAVLAAAGHSHAAVLPEPPVEKTLPNGLRVLVFPRPQAGFVQVQVILSAGTIAEAADQRGAAPLVSQMLRLGTSSRSAESFGEDIDRLGGSYAAAATRENAAIGAAYLPEDLEAGLELLSDAIVNPIFDAAVFERVRDQAVRELVRLHGDPVATAEEQLWPFALAGLPAARPPLGDLTSLFTLTRESLRSFHRDHYRPDRAVLAIAGDVTAERAFAAAGEWFGRWAGRGTSLPAASAAASVPAGTRILLVDRPDLASASVRLGWSLPGREASDDAARAVAVSLFDDALGKRLANRLPAGAGLGAGIAQLRGAGLLDVRFNVPADSAAVAIERVRRAVRLTRDAAPDPARLAEWTAQIRATYPMRFGTVGGMLAQWLAADAAGGGATAALESYPARVAALDGAAVTAALKRGWDLERTAVVVIGPAAKLRGPLARIGTVTEVKLDQPPDESAAAAPVAPPTEAEKKLGRERIDKAIAAHGGLAALKGIKDLVSEARIRLVLQGQELRGELRQIRKEPMKMVYLTQFESFESRQVLNGDRAWSVTPTGELQAADSVGTLALQSGFSSDVPHLLLAAADPTTQVADRGTMRIGKQDLWAVEITPVRGQRRRLYLDPATAHLTAMEQHEAGARATGVPARRLYRDMRKVDGILMPFEEERQLEGQTVMNVYVTKLQVNADVSEDEFTPPASMAPSLEKK
jgi:zinc protease